MSRYAYIIKKKDNTTRYTFRGGDTLEYSGTRMGERFLTVKITSPSAIAFAFGDYIDYRGERFTINYDPSVVKRSSPNTVGDGFTYDSIKFNSLANELSVCDFNDIVLDDNNLHYTFLPKFSFYCNNVDDLLDRIQANLNELYYTEETVNSSVVRTGIWKLYSPNSSRSSQRCGDLYNEEEWLTYYTNQQYEYEKTNVSISVENVTCWDALSYANTNFKLNFIIKGRTVAVGSNNKLITRVINEDGLTDDNAPFEYGKGNGLLSISKTSEGSQYLITRLKAYGSDRNLPSGYYSYCNMTPFVKTHTSQAVGGVSMTLSHIKFIREVVYTGYYYAVADTLYQNGLQVGLPHTSIITNDVRVSRGCENKTVECLLVGGFDFSSLYFKNKVYGKYRVQLQLQSGNTSRYLSGIQVTSLANITSGGADDYWETGGLSNVSSNGGNGTCFIVGMTYAELSPYLNTKVYVTSGAKKASWPTEYADWQNQLPNGYACNTLMLPGFPGQSLRTWYQNSGRTDVSDATLLSNEQYRPYIESSNKTSYGIRPFSKYFDTDDDETEEIYPTIEKITFSQLSAAGYTFPENIYYTSTFRIDAILAADNPVKGLYDTDKELEESEKYFNVYVRDMGVDFLSEFTEDFTITFNSGKCGGRSFKVFDVEKTSVNRPYNGETLSSVSCWKFVCVREYDSATNRYYPYVETFSNNHTEDYSISGSSISGGSASNYTEGDRFVLSGIDMPKAFIDAASIRLFEKALAYLGSNDTTKFTYEPKLDNIFFAREYDNAPNPSSSLYWNICEGSLFKFSDAQITEGNAVSVFIDQLIIKEGSSLIPELSIVLKDDTSVGLVQKLQNKISDVEQKQSEGLTYETAKKRFLQKTVSDTAAEVTTFDKGLVSNGDLNVNAKTNTKTLQVGNNATVNGQLESKGKIIADSGIRTEQYAPGMAGYGANIDESGNAHLQSLVVRQFLEVPELRYNRASVETGTSWQSEGGGTIEKVTVNNGCYVKLESGEIGALEVGDLCMGIWHQESGNATTTTDNKAGDFTFAGFTTIYFAIASIPATDPENKSNADKHYFTYTLRDGYPTPPFAGMTWVQRGSTNVSFPNRRNFKYRTPSYEVAYADVNTWAFNSANIRYIFGNLDGWTVTARRRNPITSVIETFTRELSGYGTFEGNAYIFGTIDQVEVVGLLMQINMNQGGLIRTEYPETATIKIKDVYGTDYTSRATNWSVSRNSGDTAADNTWNNTQRQTVNPLTIAISDLNQSCLDKSQTFTWSAEVEGKVISGSVSVGTQTDIEVRIESSEGDFINEKNGTTTLTANLYIGGTKLGNALRDTLIQEYNFKWYVGSSNVAETVVTANQLPVNASTTTWTNKKSKYSFRATIDNTNNIVAESGDNLITEDSNNLITE